MILRLVVNTEQRRELAGLFGVDYLTVARPSRGTTVLLPVEQETTMLLHEVTMMEINETLRL